MSTPATVEIWESNQAGEVTTKLISLSFGSDDIPNMVPQNHPIVIPPSGTAISYQKWTRWKVVAWVDTNTIDTFKWFNSAAVLGPGWGTLCGATANPTYVTPARNLTGISTGWPTDIGSAVSITGTFSNPTVGYSSYARMVVDIDSSATPNALKGAHTITYRYNES